MDYLIETNFAGPNFVMVPNSVAQGALSAEALGVLVYLASLPRGFVARVSVIRERFGIGKEKWQRIARELRGAGAMTVEPVRGPGGKVYGKRTVITWPDASEATEGRETRPSDRKPGKPTVGKPAKQGRETRQTGPQNPAPYKEQKQKKGPPAVSLDFEKMTAWQIEALRIGTITCGLPRGSQAFAEAQAAAGRWQSEQTDRRHAMAGGEVLRKGASE